MNLPLLTLCNTKTKSILYVPIESVRPNPYQPRHRFEQKTLEELAESIKSYGILQPLSVRRQSGGMYELIAGERRLRAAKLAGLSNVPVIINDISETDSAAVALLENLQREDLSYMEEAQAIHNLINRHHLTQEVLAEKIGKNQSTIANKLRLLKLPPSVLKILSENALTERHARALLRLEGEQQQLDVLKQVCEKNLNVSQTESLIESYINKQTAATQKKKNFFVGHNNVRIIVNTIKQSIKMIRDAGMEASMRESSGADFVEYTIKIKKPQNESS